MAARIQRIKGNENPKALYKKFDFAKLKNKRAEVGSVLYAKNLD
jgi:hypothetical protein